ncbi:thiamine diphosphokinase [Haloimpatiens sp. FM7315]|uniref:thiamine diphosphokinase n=1 Tax=Haloimpatiens sp. FM7315 TaxID=3298609 RepID=UPI0035A280EB
MKVLIVSGGKKPSKALLKIEASNSDYIICADSGANAVKEADIRPNLLLGDFDSINNDTLEYFKKENCNIVTFPKEKDFTDSELAIRKAMELGASSLVLLGFTGTRVDHLLGNLGLLNLCLLKGIKATIKDDNNIIFLSDKPLKLSSLNKRIFSIQAYCEEVKGLTIKGAKYPLVNYDLKLGQPITISNEFLKGDVEINFKSGKILVIFSKD